MKVRERTIDLLAAKDLAEQALETKSRFLSTLSHEVRTPMSGVIGVVELLNVTAKDEEMRELSALALESCKRLLQILNDFLMPQNFKLVQSLSSIDIFQSILWSMKSFNWLPRKPVGRTLNCQLWSSQVFLTAYVVTP